MREWFAIEVHTGERRRCEAPTYGDAVETWFPLACAQEQSFNALAINAANPDVLVIIDGDTGEHQCWRVACVRGLSEADEIRQLAAMASRCAEDIDDADVPSIEEWRDASWALAAFDQISRELAWEAKRLDQQEEHA